MRGGALWQLLALHTSGVFEATTFGAARDVQTRAPAPHVIRLLAVLAVDGFGRTLANDLVAVDPDLLEGRVNLAVDYTAPVQRVAALCERADRRSAATGGPGMH